MGERLSIDLTKYVGRDLGTVTLLNLIGQGGTGAVFTAFQRTLKRQVAVKILPKTAAMSGVDKALFRQEAEIIGGLSHGNIVPIFEMGETDDCFFQVMQLVKGADLEKTMKRRALHPVPGRRVYAPADAIALVNPILDGLAYAHDEGLVHQDIKPGNILIEERNNRPLIVDFGIAKIQDAESFKEDGVVLGTPLYMAPEQAANQPTDSRADIYSMGILLYRILVERLPLAVRSSMQLFERKAMAPDTLFTHRPSQVSPAISIPLERIIMKAIEPDPSRRYQDCMAFKSELERLRL